MQPSLKRSLVQGGLWVVIGKTSTAGSSLIVRALLARVLAPEEYGVFFKAYSLVLVGSMLAQLGLHQSVVRLIAELTGAGEESRVRGIVGLVYRWAFFGMLAVVALLQFGPGSWLARGLWNSDLLAASMGAVSAWLALKSFEVITSETFRGFKDLRFAAIFGGAITALLNVVVLLVLWLVLGTTDLGVVLWIIVGSTAISVLSGLVVLLVKLRPLPRGETVPGGDVFQLSWPLWLNGLVTYGMVQADIWILGATIGNAELAIYGVAASAVALVSQSLILVNLVVPPYIADLYARGERRRLERILRTTATLAGVPAFVILCAFIFFGGPILALLYTEPYRAGATILAVLSVGKMVNVLTGSCGVTMTMTGHQTVLLRITAVSTTLTLGAALLAVGRYGALGVAAAVSLGTVVQNLAMWLLTRRVTGMWTHMALPTRAELGELLGLLRSRKG
jgi:O-antigen/teichoic acid export membrane protein